jgi:hypothetical protein
LAPPHLYISNKIFSCDKPRKFQTQVEPFLAPLSPLQETIPTQKEWTCFNCLVAGRAKSFYCYGLQIFAIVITWIIVFWNMMARMFFRTSLKTEVAVSQKFWMIFTRATKSNLKVQ